MKELTKEEILDSIVRDWTTPITRQDCYEAMEQYAEYLQESLLIKKNLQSKIDEQMREMYIHTESLRRMLDGAEEEIDRLKKLFEKEVRQGILGMGDDEQMEQLWQQYKKENNL